MRGTQTFSSISYQSPEEIGRVPHVPEFPVESNGFHNFMRLSLKKGAHVDLPEATCRKFGVFAPPYMGRKRWAQPNDRFC
jgi:hypothetical protein